MQKTARGLSPVELRVRQEAHALAFANGVPGGVVDEPIGPGRRGEHRRILRRIELEAALRVPFRAEELAPRGGLGPVEVGARRDGARGGLEHSLALEQEWANKNQKRDEAGHRVARQADEER